MEALRRFLLLGLGALVALLVPAAAADAYTYVLRPNVTHASGSWIVVPSGSIDSVLDDNVLSPAAPSTIGDYAWHDTAGAASAFEAGMSDVTLRGGESVTSVKSWAYAAVGDTRTLDAELLSGVTVLASDTWPQNMPAQWRSVSYNGTLTQAELDDLRERRTLQGAGVGTPTYVYASYAEVATDMAAPAPTITSGPPAYGQATNPSWQFSAALAAGYECRLDQGATIVSDWAPCSSPRPYDLTATGDGTYTFLVRAVDDVGVAGPSTSATYTLDRAPPAAPTITSSPPSTAADPAASWSFTGEGGAIHSCRLTRDGGTVVEDWTVCTSPKGYDLTAQPDGVYTFEVHSTDLAGNTGPDATSATFTLDRTAPAVPTVTSSPPAAGNDPAPSWSFTPEAGSNASCRLERGATVIGDWAACASPRSYDLSGEADGTYTFRLRAADAAGNTSGEYTDTYDLDRAAPAAPSITSGPTGTSNNAAPSFGFTAEAGAATQCRIERDATVVSDWSACVSPRSYDLSLQPDGVVAFRVRATDAAGNTGAEATRTYTLDRTAPVAPVIGSGPPAATNNPVVGFSFTAEPGATIECRLRRGVTTVFNWAPCTSPRSYDISGEIDGSYTFSVRAIDAAGNTGPNGTHAFTLDRSAPAAPAITSAPPAAGSATSPSWSFTAEAGSTTSCRIERGATVVSDWAVCSSPRSYNLAAEVDGTYTFRVRAMDAAGNTGAEATGTYTLDRVPPPAPTITAGPTGDSQNAAPSYSFTAEAGASTQCRIERGATVVSDWAACVSPRSYDLSLQSDGTYTFRVRATDAAGNTGADATRTYTLDRSAPVAPTITGGPPANGSDAGPVFSFTGEAGATLTCRMERGATVVEDWTACSSPKGYDLSAQPDGTYTFRVRATDAAGNTGAAATRNYTLDRVAPNAPTIASAPGAVTNDATPTWSWTADPDAIAFNCRIERGATVISNWSSCTSPHTFDLTGEIDGTYTFRVRATDSAGNVSATPTTDTFALDRVAPVGPVISSGPTGLSANAMPSYSFTAEAGASTQCRMERGATVVSDWSACVSPRSYDLTLQPDGAYTFRVRATDAAGNTGPDATRSYTLDRTPPAAPTITSGPAANSNDDTPVWSFSGEPGATFACRVLRGATIVSDWTACSTPAGYDLSAQVDGTYTFEVRATDGAGNTGPAGTATYSLDRQAPAAPMITALPGAQSNDDTPTWSFNHEAGSSASCRLERGATVISDWSSCTSPRTYDLTAQPEGAYTFRVRATDTASNTGPDAANTFTLDRTAPVAPTITGGPVASSSDDGPAYTFTYEAGASATCRMERGVTVVSDWTPCSSPKVYDLSAQPDGAYTFRVRATDPAGNTGAAATRSYTLDRIAPPAPTITARPAAATNDDTPTWSWTGDPDTTSFNCRLERGATVVSDWELCASPKTYDLSAHPDGTYTFRVRGSDAAANDGTESTDSFALDRAAPAAPSITAGPTGFSQTANPSYAFSAEPGATTACRIERGATVVSDWVACSSPRAYDLTAQPDGAYTFRVRATDAAGNTGPDATRDYTLDRTAPAAPSITAGPTGDLTDDTPTYAFTAEAAAVTTCRLERGATVVSDWTACASPQTYDVSAEADGVYTLRVRATDMAGNTGPDAARVYTLDRTAPVAPSITAGPAADSTDDSPTFAFTAEAGAALECRLARGATTIEDWTACTSPRTYDVSAEPDGTYTFSVRATDAAGNTGPAGTRTYTLDRTVPLAPALDARPGDDGNDRTPAWAFSTPEPSKTFECRLERGATVLQDWAACVSPREFDLQLEPDGTYTFAVRAVNLAGTRSPATTDTYRLDTVAPVAPAISGGPAPDSTDDTPTWTLTTEPTATLECRLERGATVVSGWAACTSPAGFDVSGEPDGTYTFRTRATDPAGNTGPEATVSYNLDRTVPLEPVVGTSPPAAGSDDTPTWSFTGEPGKTFECRVARGATVLQDWTACTSPFTPDLTGEPDGTYTVEVRAVNAAGTRSPEHTDTYDLDRVAPVAPTITDGPPADSADGTPTWSFTGEAGASFECRLERGGTVVQDWAACSSPEAQDLAGEPDGTYTFRVRAVDDAGNTGPDASRDYALDRTVPGAPSIDTTPTTPAADTTPAWTVSGDAAPIERECRVTRSGAVVVDWSPCGSPHEPDLSAEPDGTYTLHVRQYNRAGTRGPEVRADYVLDTAAAPAPVITAHPGVTGSVSSPSWSFTAEAGATLECRLERGTDAVRAWAACTSPRDYDLTGEPDGGYRFSVRATDAAGNTGPAALHSYELDRVAPAPPALTAGPGPLGNGRRPVWAFTAEPGSVFECRLDRDGTPLEGWGACSSPRGFELEGQSDGAFTFAVRAIDAAGNVGGETASPYQLDTTPGAVQIESGPGPLGRDRKPRWTFSGEPGAAFECRLSLGTAPVSDWSPCTPPRSFDLAGLPDGMFRFSLRATDAAGNVGPVGETQYQLDTLPPARPAITREPSSPGSDRSPSWRFTGETGASFSCRVDRGADATLLDWAPCESPFSAALPGEPAEATYRFLVRATDRAGNTGEQATSSYELRPEKKEDGGDAGRTTTVARQDASGPPAAAKARKPRKPRVAEPRPKPRAAGLTKRPHRRRERAKSPVRAPRRAVKERDEKGNFATRALADVASAIAENPEKSAFPLGLILLVAAFLGVQNRLDRGDPKLALAPSFADPDLEFRPPPGNEP